MKRPLIGVVPIWDETKDSFWMLPGYLDGIEAANGIPVTLPLTGNSSVVRQLAETVDGILFTGGHDIAPALYGQEKNGECGYIHPPRDETERLLFAEALRLDMPVFGICRGLQMFNALLGGDLYQDLPSQKDSQIRHKQQQPYDHPAHKVQVLPGTPLHDLLGESSLSVNSCHHQGICTLAPGLVTMAHATDGLTEAIYLPGKAFVWAVQWHPEYSLKDPASRALFRAFVAACEKRLST